MKRIFLFSFFLLTFVFAGNFAVLYAQAQQQQQPVILKPKVEVADLIFVINTLNTIEIIGNEVEAFLACKEVFEKELQKVQKEQKVPTDSIVISISAPIAQNLISFMGRAKIAGANAGRYKAFIDAILLSAREYQQKQ